MQYRIISVSSAWSQKTAIEQLVREVNDAIKQGWEPTGGVSFSGCQVMQALVKPR